MPYRLMDLLFRILRQNGGTLSRRLANAISQALPTPNR